MSRLGVASTHMVQAKMLIICFLSSFRIHQAISKLIGTHTDYSRVLTLTIVRNITEDKLISVQTLNDRKEQKEKGKQLGP
mmetsp:Transcript_14526/g.20230  ORF Transcript_14526/g.20230 Transcript_14526/m.20230 type:complete len:80 (+) Transcript_14526:301-540(+)